MSYCVKCGNKVEDGFAFCPKCGFKIGNNNEEQKLQTKVIKEEPKQTTIDKNIFAYNEQEMKKYEICNKTKFKKGTKRGIIFLVTGILTLPLIPVGFFLLFFSLANFLNGNYAEREKLFLGQCKKIERGMSIHQIRAMFAFTKPIEEYFNRHSEYVISYNSRNRAPGNNEDYEQITIIFDSNARVVEYATSHRRTR